MIEIFSLMVLVKVLDLPSDIYTYSKYILGDNFFPQMYTFSSKNCSFFKYDHVI